MDGQIKIGISVDGKQVDVASKSLDNLETAGNDAGKGVKTTEDGLKGVGQESTKASGNVKKFATALGLVAIGAAAFNTLRQSMDAAISRFDTLNTFPKVLQALGVSAEDSERSVARLSDGIDGLPTKLDEISSTAQRMYTSFNDMDKATDSALALNNALLGSGASAEEAQRGTDQYLKALQTGKMEMDTWNSLSETMDVGLIKIAEGFGFAGASAKNDLYAALQDGTITMDQFNDKLIEVGTGTGIMAELAKENSLGIATSLSNLRNAAARGIANIIESFNNLSKEVTGNDIAQNIDGMKNIVNAAFNVIGNVIEGTTPIIKGFASAVKAVIPVVQSLTPLIIGLATAYAAYTVITKASAAIQASNAVLKVAMASTSALTVATKAQTTAQVAQTGAVKLSTLAIGLMTGAVKLSTVAAIAKTAATNALGVALRFLSGPVGWVTVGIGALATAAVAVVKWFKKSTEESKRLNAETEELAVSSDSLISSINSTSEAYKGNQNEIKATAEANQDLANRIEELAEKENKSAAEKQMLAQYVEQLNGQIEGLSLAYNEEADALSMSSEEMQARVDLMKEQEAGIAAQERLLEISKEQHEVDQQLKEINAQREESIRLHDEEKISKSDHKEATEELDKKEKALTETKAQLAEQQAETEAQLTASMEAITEATESGVSNQKIAFEELSESQQQTVENMKSTWEDYKAAATDMFDTLSDEVEITASEMAANLEENQRVISEWSTNIATLAERGVDEGLLNTLREAGPESAGHVNALVNASDEELAHLSEVFAEGGDVATDALSKSLGIEKSGVMEAVGHLVTDTEQALSQQIQSADFESLGIDIAKGQAGGIEKGTPEAEKAAQNMAKATEDAAREESETHSPSRVFMRIGNDLADGLALGISNGTSKVTQAIQKMFRSVEVDSTRNFRIITKNYDDAVKQIEKSLEKLPKITQESMKKMLDRLKSGTKSNVNLMKQHAVDLLNPFNNTPSQFESIGQDAMSGLNRGLNAGKPKVMATARSIANSVATTMRDALDTHSPSRETMKIGEDVGEGLVIGMDKKESDVSNAAARMASSIKEEFDNSKQWIDDRKYYNELSLMEELKAWERVQARYEQGTEQRKQADKEVYRVKKQINDQLISIDEDYFKQVQDINQRLIDGENKLNDAYKKAVGDRTNALYSFAGIFDEVQQKSDVSGQQLIDNLKGQVDTFADWSNNIQKLAERGIDDGLLAELQDMGPKAAAEIKALNGLTDEQLSEYTSLWKEKNRLAREQATEELEGLRLDTEKQIDELHAQSEKQLEKLNEEWQSKIKEIRHGTKSELSIMRSDLRTIGEQSMQGMIAGLESMRGPLMAKARSIANAVKSTMQSALDINSPSGVMRDEVGRWIPEGIALGIKDNAKSVYSELDKLSKGMIMTSTPEQALGTSRMAYASGGGVSNNSSTTNNDQSRKMENHITIKTYDSGAKEMERTLRRLQFGF